MSTARAAIAGSAAHAPRSGVTACSAVTAAGTFSPDIGRSARVKISGEPSSFPGCRLHLSTVSERTFIIDEEHAKLYGIESVLEQVSLGVLSRGGVVSIAGLDENLQSQIRLASTANQRLFGLNRFYAGDSETCKIIGGYGDETGHAYGCSPVVTWTRRWAHTAMN